MWPWNRPHAYGAGARKQKNITNKRRGGGGGDGDGVAEVMVMAWRWCCWGCPAGDQGRAGRAAHGKRSLAGVSKVKVLIVGPQRGIAFGVFCARLPAFFGLQQQTYTRKTGG